jgi:hypothetical protein
MEVAETAPHPQFAQLKDIQVTRQSERYYGEFWQLKETLHVHYNLLITINTNGDQATLVQVGRALLQQDSQGGGNASGLVSRLRSHGLAITLTVPRAEYPANALVQVELSVKNVSRHTIFIRSGLQTPTAFVLDASGADVFDPSSPLGPDSLLVRSGPGPRSEALYKGETWMDRPYLVLRGNRISYSVLLGKVGHGGAQITGRPVSVRLTDEPAPPVSVTSTPSLQASVSPPETVSGPMMYFGETSCVTPNGTYSIGDGWTAITGTVVTPDFSEGSDNTPGCKEKRIWHGLLGWLNHPVAEITYEEAPRGVS